MRDRTAKQLSRIHRLVYQGTGGRIGRRFVANDMLLLTTTGRHSGKPHTVPLLYLPDAPDVLVIASWGGRDYPPDWYVNLTQEPAVRVQIDGASYKAVANTLDEQSRSAWWDRFVTAYGGYTTYQSRTERVIPVVRLEIDRSARLEHGKEHADGAA